MTEEFIGTFTISCRSKSSISGGDIFCEGDNFFIRNPTIGILNMDGWRLEKLEQYCYSNDIRLKLSYHDENYRTGMTG